MRSWSPWVAERRAKRNKPYTGALWMTDEGPVPYSQALADGLVRIGGDVFMSDAIRIQDHERGF
jgi:hypothetical protein